MTSFIIVSKNKKRRETYSREFCKKLEINEFDVTFLEKDSTVKNTQSIGIEDIKQIQKKIFLKPIRSKTKAIILEDSQLLTIEAQNALLKILEEPPDHTILLLGTETKEALLPTIISRCQVIALEEDQTKLTEVETREYDEFIKNFANLSVGDRLKSTCKRQRESYQMGRDINHHIKRKSNRKLLFKQ